MGHVRDLPASASGIPTAYKGESWSRLGVNVQQDFDPLYVIPKDKKKVVAELRKLLKEADELILATDEDRRESDRQPRNYPYGGLQIGQ